MSKQAWLASELDKQIQRFDKESEKHKVMHRRFRILSFVLAGAATITAGIPLALSEHQAASSFAALIITATLTVVNSIEGLRKAGELWAHERTTLYRLRDIQRDLRYLSEGPVLAGKVDELYDRMQEALESSGDQWLRLTARDKAESKPNK